MLNSLEIISIIVVAIMTIGDWMITNFAVFIIAYMVTMLAKNYITSK